MDRAGKGYWSNLWQISSMPKAFDPGKHGLSSYINQRYHTYLSDLFKFLKPKNKRLLEIGCARSIWLPYFSKEFGFQVTGIDYSEEGCRQAREMMNREGVKGDVICTDLYSPPKSLLGTFDTVVSFGVVEHFNDIYACLRAFSQYLKPGGTIITFIPNLTGMMGILQKVLNKKVYDIHVAVGLEGLRAAHEYAGFEVVSCTYFIFINFGVINLADMSNRPFHIFLKRAIRYSLQQIARVLWIFEILVVPLPANRYTSPYIACVAKNFRKLLR
ncbi:MAG: class I SAM-dependent methyltransferase [Deltaproteobacteria bacterium]|nr:class I SAM-dependent methyltransferase [Deltaproteobacteria bacterium]